MVRPEDYYYTETHEWVRKEGDEVVIGITDYAVEQLSDLVHIELPEAGDTIEQDSAFGEIESVKAVSDLIAPLSGTVVAVNKEVLQELDLLAQDPYGEGWLMRIKTKEPQEQSTLLDAAGYRDFLESETAEEEEEDEADEMDELDMDDD